MLDSFVICICHNSKSSFAVFGFGVDLVLTTSEKQIKVEIMVYTNWRYQTI